MKVAEKVLNAINEMAVIGRFENCSIIINSNDHEPPHVHLLKDNKLVAKIEIPLEPVKNQSELKILKRGLIFKDFLLSDFVVWVNNTRTEEKTKVKNYEAALIVWNTLHDQ